MHCLLTLTTLAAAPLQNPSKCKPKGACTYRLSASAMARPMISLLDYNLVDLPLNPNVSKADGWQQHSVQADPGFLSRNKPWEKNWTDFVATSAAAKAVGQPPTTVSGSSGHTSDLPHDSN